MSPFEFYAQQLAELQRKDQLRSFADIQHQGKYILKNQQKMLNLSSNDYLGIASDERLQQQFLQQLDLQQTPPTSSSSRLLTGNFAIYSQLEQRLATLFERESALIFNSGYHANIGILPALSDKHTLILADKLVHASLIDGIRLSDAKFFRYRHNDYAHLAELLARHANDYRTVIVVTESVFSMDGDLADLPELVRLKKAYPNLLLYVDEAHAIGVLGEKGLGLAEQMGCIGDIDLLVGTFGKAVASMGAYLVCDELIRTLLINKMRPLIFSTALSPMVVAWTDFVMQRLPTWQAKRQRLAMLSERLRHAISVQSDQPMSSASHIVPWILGDNDKAVAKALSLQQHGFYCLPIRPPTVPVGTARIRLSLTADISDDELAQFLTQIHS